MNLHYTTCDSGKVRTIKYICPHPFQLQLCVYWAQRQFLFERMCDKSFGFHQAKRGQHHSAKSWTSTVKQWRTLQQPTWRKTDGCHWKVDLIKRSTRAIKIVVAGKKKIHNLFSSLRKSMAQPPLRLLSNSGAVFSSISPLPERRFYIRRLFERNEVRKTQWDALWMCFLLRVRDKKKKSSKVSLNILNVFWRKTEKKKNGLGVMTMQNIIWRL